MQRSGRAQVEIDGVIVGSIDAGVVVLVGVSQADGVDEARWLADKVANMRIFNDADGKMNMSLLEVGAAALVVSQFTLYGDARRGRRPSFTKAARGPDAESVYDEVIRHLAALGVTAESGRFGATMNVTLTNEGPVTILLDSEKTF